MVSAHGGSGSQQHRLVRPSRGAVLVEARGEFGGRVCTGSGASTRQRWSVVASTRQRWSVVLLAVLLAAVVVSPAVNAVPVSKLAAGPTPHSAPRCQLGWYKQPLDHFNPHDHRVFNQRYYTCNQHFDINRGPVILFLCGEGVCDSGKVLGTYAESLAKRFGALLITLEHRFYGSSLPFHRTGEAELAFLNPEQAIEDAAAFVAFYARRLAYGGLTPVHLGNDGGVVPDRVVPWVVMGGSYGGSLAAWFRAKYPHFTVGGIASSAPMVPAVAFPQYDAEVGRALGAACHGLVTAAVTAIDGALRAGAARGREVKAYFNATGLGDNDFTLMVGDVISMTVQYGYKDVLCGFMGHAAPGPDGGLAALAAHATQFYFMVLETGGPNDYSSELMGESLSDSDWGGRQWWWQRCTRLGYFQTTAGPAGVRPARVTAGFYRGFCAALFPSAPWPGPGPGLPWTVGSLGVGNMTNMCFTNGGEDPWRLVSITAPVPSSPTILVGVADCSGCGHTTDLRLPDDKHDPIELTVLRAAVEESVAAWLAGHHRRHMETASATAS